LFTAQARPDQNAIAKIAMIAKNRREWIADTAMFGNPGALGNRSGPPDAKPRVSAGQS
jgi:hypothetical protein